MKKAGMAGVARSGLAWPTSLGGEALAWNAVHFQLALYHITSFIIKMIGYKVLVT